MKGTIDEYKPGCWRVRIYFNGQRIQIYRGKDGKVFEGPKGAISAQAQITREIEEKEFNPKEWGRPQIFRVRNAYEEYIKIPSRTLETIRNLRSRFEAHILPELGEMDMREIRTVHLNKLHGSLISKNLKPNTIKNILRSLKSLFAFNNIHNKDLIWPKMEVPEIQIVWLTVEQQEAVMNYLKEVDKPIFEFMKMTGCRSSEACALERKDIDWQKQTVTIQRSFGYRKRQVSTKSREIRIIPLSIFSSTDIFRPTVISSFVFSRKTKPYCAAILRKIWYEASRKANKDLGTPVIRVKNAFRHSMASQLINAGVPIGFISKMLGHSSIETTEAAYAKILPEIAWGHRKVIPIRGKNGSEQVTNGLQQAKKDSTSI